MTRSDGWRSLRKYLHPILALIISGFSLYLALRQVNLREVWRAFIQTDYAWLSLAFLVVLFTMGLKIWRWLILLSGREFFHRPIQVGVVFLLGQLFNALYPARIGDISRIYLLGKETDAMAYLTASVALEKIFDSLAYAFLFVVLILILPLPSWVNQSGYLMFLFAFLLGAVTLAAVVYHQRFLAWLKNFANRFPERFRSPMLGLLEDGFQGLRIASQGGHLWRLVVSTILIWLAAWATNHLALWAMRIHLPWSASLLLLVALMVGISLPSAPGRIGIFEYACVLALSVFNIDHSLAFTYGLVLHGIVYLPILTLGIVSFGVAERKAYGT